MQFPSYHHRPKRRRQEGVFAGRLPTDVTVGERLRAERKRIELTQAAMAAVCGVRPNAQMGYEKSLRMPRADYLREAAKLGLDCSYVITGQRTPEVGVFLSDDESRILRLVLTLRQKDRDALIRVLQRISQSIPQHE